MEKDCDSKRIDSVRVYRPKFSTANAGRRSTTTSDAPSSKKSSYRGIRFYNLIFLMLYVVQLSWVGSTIGEPYRQFLEKADREGFQVMEGTTRLRAELEHNLLRDLNDPNRRTNKIGWMDWMDMDVEELAAEKKRDRERNVLDSLPKNLRVPHKYAASFWPTLLLGMLATLHALVLLMQHWSVRFNVWINYTEMDADQVTDLIPANMLDIEVDHPVKKKKEGDVLVPDHVIEAVPSRLPTHARIKPSKEGSRDELVPLEYYPVLGMTFEYHRRRFVYDSKVGVWGKIRCRTDLQLQFLNQWHGLVTQHQLLTAQIRHGPNVFRIKQPQFLDLYKKQLLNPFSVFQIFCVLLWAIDDYLIYSFFSLFMVLVFEATVVLQRLKSMQVLRGMGNPTRLVHVFRQQRWVAVDTTDLLPGDVVSLTLVQPHYRASLPANLGAPNKDVKQATLRKIEDEGGDTVPADLFLLRGSTVVNEASLTGESVPQMKEGVVLDEIGDATLDIKNHHKNNVVYAGTKMLQCKGTADYSTNRSLFPHIPNPPDQGCVCFVLRTGFASAQGKLVRMIEGSQEKVKGHERETGLLLLLLCFFAILSSSYVLFHGAQNENRSKYELLLHCILIVTNVIRPELPMQMALAVNNSLMTLMRMHVFCTEPYRVPLAGKLDCCLFDKTGTLTTDELVAVGVCDVESLLSNQSKAPKLEHLTPLVKVTGEWALVLAGCHSLVNVDGVTSGDPLESASLTSMRWHVDDTGVSRPVPATSKKAAGKKLMLGQTVVDDVEILARHHFSSKLQRMSCVVKVNGGMYYTVAKGSPEAIGLLLQHIPNGYYTTSEFLSKKGYRVIALAFKSIGSVDDVESAKQHRIQCESNLTFAGFVVFTCMVRKDSSHVLKRLREGGMKLAMVTGDALLTAIHVAKEVRIFELHDELGLLDQRTNQDGHRATDEMVNKLFRPILYLDTRESDDLIWASYEDGSKVAKFDAKNVPLLARTFELATTGRCLSLALAADHKTQTVLHYIKVFARMTPDAKESLIESLQTCNMLTMMTGDGANDVGALKQADVGVALLTGFGNVNADSYANESLVTDKDSRYLTTIISQSEIAETRALPISQLKERLRSLGEDPAKYPHIKEKEDLVKIYIAKRRAFVANSQDEKNELDRMNMTPAELKAEHQKELRRKQEEIQLKIARRTEELASKGVSFASFKAMREVMADEMKANKQKASLASGIEGSASAFAAQLEGMDSGELPMVKLGDASAAAPFTSKIPSIRSCVDIVRQGRCTLVSSIQMYQIMALQCLISSYSLSVLYLDGVKYGDTQMTAMGILGSVSFMSVSRSKPLEALSSVRPLNSIFHPALFLSLLCQFAVHLATMIVAVQTSKRYLPPDFEVDLDGSFKPGILNTVVFLVSSVQQVTVFVVNLQGRPFMTGLSENRPLLWSLAATFVLTFMFASETVPGLNRYFQLVPFPNESFRDFILLLLGADLMLTFLLDRLMQFLFCRAILMASLKGTTLKDILGLGRTMAVVAVLMTLFLGNSETWESLLDLDMNTCLTQSTAMMTSVQPSNSCVGEHCSVSSENAQSLTTEF